MKWNGSENPKISFTPDQKLLIKRAKISVNIVLRESDQIAKYELFQRLNTGGTNLSPQEVRNCMLVMVNPLFHEKLRNLSKHLSFQETIALSQNNIDEQYDVELALRFLVFATINLKNYDRSADVGAYITDQMIAFAKDDHYDWTTMEKRFKKTFDSIAKALSSNAFRRYTERQFKGGFLLSPFEVIAYGLGYSYPKCPEPKMIEQITKELHENETYKKWSGSGVRANTRLPHLIPLGRKLYAK